MTEMDILKNSCLQFVVEDDFSLFLRFDDLLSPIVEPGMDLSAIANSCYISREKVFG